MVKPADMSDEAFAWARDVDRRVAGMTAGSFYALAEEIIGEIGKERGKALIRRAIRNYGLAGGRARAAVHRAAAMPLTAENYVGSGETYALGWELSPDGEVSYCPIAALWKQMGPEAMDLGYLFCEVDFALVEGYNPELELHRPLCIAKGDAICRFIIEPRKS